MKARLKLDLKARIARIEKLVMNILFGSDYITFILCVEVESLNIDVEVLC